MDAAAGADLSGTVNYLAAVWAIVAFFWSITFIATDWRSKVATAGGITILLSGAAIAALHDGPGLGGPVSKIASTAHGDIDPRVRVAR